MFESTKWILKDSDCMHVDKYNSIVPIVVRPLENASLTKNMNQVREIGIIQQYQFSSSLQRMSVIVRASGSDDFRAYTKGSPEMIINLSKTETVPKDISLILERFTRQGFRVIAMGRRATISKSGAEVIIRATFSSFPYKYAHTLVTHELKNILYLQTQRDISRKMRMLVDIETVSRNG